MLIIFLFSLIQGFTEFLPISSQGHLIVFNEFLELDNTNISIHDATILAHFGSLFAVMIYYSRTIKNFILSIKLIDRPDIDKNSFLLVNIITSTIPVLFVGYFFSKFFKYESDNILLIIAISSIVFGLLMFFIDSFSLRIKNQNSLNYLTSFYIGIFQCLALVPGVSRSGSVLTIMRYLGFQRRFCVFYSNLLSIPVIIAATSFMFFSQYESQVLEEIFSFDGIMIFAYSFIFSILFIFFFVSWVKRFSLSIFVIYRLLFGIFLILYII